ncbi:MAG: tRNA (guanosine(37)-N1)-methyltransferase TrmD [Mogibacterium diversum]|uniref:tRNA (guanine-N(1)-)-methyltransferase n=1 Tax=Mogibacterium diversum TaxID=114527 RepID=A0A930HAD2_9FIRM|nr:tRNA (guanosine(37)-N1)-methyltransferase TrmD [Mogibacterium diversum]
MKINIMTLFPEMFEPIRSSMIGRAADNGIIELNIVNIRDYTEDKHCRVDDTPFGGGAGMLMQVQPIISCYRQNEFAGRTIYMSPRGRKLSQETAEELAGEGELTILCGHYEGVDERALTELSAEEISIGDYVLTGGELPAMVLVDAVARFIPGVLASDESVLEESIYSGLLEYPQYTRPRTMEEGEVPEVLLSGDHKKIDLWRFEQAMRLTKERRPDMWQEFVEKFRTDEKAYSKKERLLIESVIRD